MKNPSKRAAAQNGTKISVLLCDDHPVVRAGVAALLEQARDLRVVAEASNGAEALAVWRAHRPDVTLLDLRMVGQHDGLGALRSIQALDPNARVVVLTTYESEEDVFQAIRAGASGYLLKDVPREDLLDAVRRVHAGETVIASRAAAKLATHTKRERLTGRELEVLQSVAVGALNKEVAGKLNIGEGTVKEHLKAIFGKLGVFSRTEAVSVARQCGLLKG